tara:strand:+ start:1207 stop:1716 length:510 start_codon:yes stop_codon:yes gene_type:complete
MGQEFFINSQDLEDKVRKLLPSQGGAGAGFDLSASTQIIPIIDLTESAEGSDLRQDLQTSLSFDTITAFSINGGTNTVIINNTGYYRVFGIILTNGATAINFNLFDGTTAKNIFALSSGTGFDQAYLPFDFNVFIDAGQSLRGNTSNTSSVLAGSTRQIADIAGNLTNP